MPLEFQIILAMAMDAVIGDPRWLPHPVRGIGRAATALEKPVRRLIASETLAGLVATLIVIASTALICWFLIMVMTEVSPWLGEAMSIVILYFGFAARDLSRHALHVKYALETDDLDLARRQVAMLVGRDTEELDHAEVSRAAVESVAENTVDAVTAPLLFALIGGPVGTMVYKAINTLDSMFGYKNDRYVHFGYFAAKIDDLANYIPARITALLTPVAATLLGFDARGSWLIFRRDRHNHPSPNGGQIEAAMAGALNVRLGGENSYFGQPSFRPYMGDNNRPLCAERIGETVRLMWAISLLMASFGLILRGGLGALAQ
ncbi:adenosylcobinamide-phosphate synthase CbiB [Trichloromonas acetexigens]|uniref:Cobalamin biosynthesis protein CobD n=1 Tax=Trichloromonas acetexigens TaxID=38815 RepID=A0A550J3M2_9BACT|nr:adenosylcobinamide-phosphate synthase CbiB [Desulfuromonas acetexigens]TRO77837.1 cobalamin biosynthesis protein CobD [Desulfuromonas acetexigens]